MAYLYLNYQLIQLLYIISLLSTVTIIYYFNKAFQLPFYFYCFFFTVAVIPAVQIVINGGYKTFLQIHETLFPNDGHKSRPTMPLVVIGNSGGAAQWIATKCELFDQDNKNASYDELHKEITTSLGSEEKSNYVINCLQEIVSQKRQYVRSSLFL